MLIKTVIAFFSSLILIKQIPFKSTRIESNVLEQFYLINGSNLYMFSNDGVVVHSYSNKNIGEITQVDVSNPMRILLYYADFNQLHFLNNKLSPIASPILLDELGYTSVGGVCNSFQNGFWIYDSQKEQPILFSSTLELKYKGTTITLPDSVTSIPLLMCEEGKRLYLAFAGYGLYIFEQTGNLLRFIPIDELKYIQIKGNYAYYLANQIFYRLDLNSYQTQMIEKKIQNFYGFTVLSDKIIFATHDSLSFYSIRQ
ncbi:MAG: hypothetical protein HPY79_02845 [Bacteroidales bacterium]|nr:hypothetical protein [Bacteroidales bacterium]